ncbi:hypothetical protein [Chryseobacterium lathyri]|uniref:hypothetical protein n=1 Tax=Chryseobacterium lathyri TaxID=395933 RepID=UPI001CBC254D|nr:hypothetical protein [Chryseobacterium lathyri]
MKCHIDFKSIWHFNPETTRDVVRRDSSHPLNINIMKLDDIITHPHSLEDVSK